jgi:GntR family transcriptional repressor for pyruvate dehydrogenase complex
LTHSAANEIAAHLERLIISGKLKEGTKLPPEREFAEKFGVSRSTLRDALRELENKHLLQRVQGRGTVVLEPPQDKWDLRRMTASTDSEYVAELRYAVEPSVARLAALRATPADVLQLEQAAAEAGVTLTKETAMDVDINFHAALARASHNPLMVAIVTTTTEWTREERVVTHSNPTWQQLSIEEHNAILDAVRRAEPDEAEKMMTEHLWAIRRRIEESQATKD